MSNVVKTFTYTGSAVTFIVPPNVVSINFQCYGAGGGVSNIGGAGGYDDGAWGQTTFPVNGSDIPNANGGGYVSGTLVVTPGDTYYLYVGGNGGNAYGSGPGSPRPHGVNAGGTAGWNGGGKGGNGYNPTSGTYNVQASGGGGGGGGATDVRHGGQALSNRLLVAGGSGGTGGGAVDYASLFLNNGTQQPLTVTDNPTNPTPPYGAHTGTPDPNTIEATIYVNGGVGKGGWGGTTTGGLAGSGTTAVTSGNPGIESPTTGGSGGTQSAGGPAGVAHGANGVAGSAGALGLGGAGAAGTSTNATAGYGSGGGGGGAGYYGGGGGGTGGISASLSVGSGGGGGGGSNYIDPSFTVQVNEPHAFPPLSQGASGLGGLMILTYTQPPNAPTVLAPVNFESFPVNSPLDFNFTFSSPDPNAQDGQNFDIEWKDVSSGGFTLQHGTGDTFEYAANFFTSGHTYLIQVRQYDTSGTVSPWAAVTVTAVTPPAAPTISTPTNGSTISASPFNVTWTNPSGSPELIYEVLFYNSLGQTIFDTGQKNAASRLNLCPNPSFETNASSWVITSPGTLVSSTGASAIGTHSGLATWGAQSNAYCYVPIATQPGLEYVVSAKVAAANATATDPDVQLAAQNPSDANPFTFGDDIGGPGVWSSLGSFVQGNLSFIAEQSVTWIVFIPGSGTTSGSMANYIDMVLAEINGSGVPLTYFDGAHLNGNTGTVGWTGTANASTSTLTNSDVLTYSMTWPYNSQAGVTVYVRYSTIAAVGIWSAAAQNVVSVNIAPPGAPTATVTPNNATGSIALAITTSDTPNPTTYVDIFRTDLTNNTPEIRVATQLIPVAHAVNWTDYTPGSGVTYAYRVRAYSATLGFADVS